MALLPTAYLRRTIRFRAIRRGLLGGSRFWTLVFFAGRIRSWAGKVTKRGQKPLVMSDELRQGEGFVIRHLGPDDS